MRSPEPCFRATSPCTHAQPVTSCGPRRSSRRRSRSPRTGSRRTQEHSRGARAGRVRRNGARDLGLEAPGPPTRWSASRRSSRASPFAEPLPGPASASTGAAGRPLNREASVREGHGANLRTDVVEPGRADAQPRPHRGPRTARRASGRAASPQTSTVRPLSRAARTTVATCRSTRGSAAARTDATGCPRSREAWSRRDRSSRWRGNPPRGRSLVVADGGGRLDHRAERWRPRTFGTVRVEARTCRSSSADATSGSGRRSSVCTLPPRSHGSGRRARQERRGRAEGLARRTPDEERRSCPRRNRAFARSRRGPGAARAGARGPDGAPASVGQRGLSRCEAPCGATRPRRLRRQGRPRPPRRMRHCRGGARDARRASAGVRGIAPTAAAAHPSDQLAVRRGERGLTGSDDDRAPAAVDDQLLPVDQQEHIQPEPDRHRHAERSGDDRGVRRRGPVGSATATTPSAPSSSSAISPGMRSRATRTVAGRDDLRARLRRRGSAPSGGRARGRRPPARRAAGRRAGQRRGVLRHRFLRGARGGIRPARRRIPASSAGSCAISMLVSTISVSSVSPAALSRAATAELLDGLGERGGRTTGLVAVACSRRVVHASHDEGTADRDPGGRPRPWCTRSLMAPRRSARGPR